MAFDQSVNLIVSGLAQGDDPSGGLSVARCVRHAFPDARITGMDYSVRGGALHDPVFDDVVVHRPWGEFETESLRSFFSEHIDQGGLVLSTIDLEAYWLAHHFPGTPAVLSPRARVFPKIAKPPEPIPALTNVAAPETIHLSKGRQACHAFLRKTGFNAWLKGPFHDALRVVSWETYDATWARLAKYWPFEGTLLQENVNGTHEAIAFAAYEGRLLDAVWIVKNDMTTGGKTVAGSRRDISSRDRQAIESYVHELGWHGGGEIELIRDGADQIWLIEINARFPSWVAGAHLLGCNLPAILVAQHLGGDVPSSTTYEGFVRVQTEIPTRSGYRLLEPIVLEPNEPLDAAKTAFNIHELANHLKQTIDLPLPERCLPISDQEKLSPTEADWVSSILEEDGPTPRVELNIEKLRARCRSLAELEDADGVGPALEIAYSMKTNPDSLVLQVIHSSGLGIEVISLAEYERAVEFGFRPAKIIVNGPGKSLDFYEKAVRDGATVFADSLEELRALEEIDSQSNFVGFRLRPPEVQSRFGIPLDDPNTVAALMGCLAKLCPRTIGVHFHVPSSSVGQYTWRALVEAVGEFALTLREETGADLTILDVGGGFYPEDIFSEIGWLCSAFRAKMHAKAPELKRLAVEPGRAIVQDCYAIVSKVQEIRCDNTKSMAVIDACLGEISEAKHFPHRVVALDGVKGASLLGLGDGKILGRTCMEDDVISPQIELSLLSAGCQVAVLDAGGYDRSMSYEFGKG